MSNLKKLTRENLRNIKGGRACSVAIQGSDGTWVTREGTCDVSFVPVGMGQSSSPVAYCNTGLGYHPVTSNGGVSRCN
ncbi:MULTISPECIES: bacteriocin-like protein [unclassified Chryseobacterium]|uniref:Uncharacterized protein n=1 Tax=Chryseobacterium camelliae TaxID=1265445 RepID=A0ABU0TJG3_9FLAO|nr:hypothetical protein [Chryseobacterium camelliae]MDQ1101104.1 hypothetical protein [Chryseobacterium sp. SORGH_AS_1048]MDR6084547.1 hypothetical protein [Chryseobacterium sp. SORGH_AS_0909]MDR6132816.1 hypothetical protein [Chryseobacterium sp. SORGH_AS_1175]MDT3408976.1 hypothetical protein [Pseudacidovorax intermedius]